MAKLVRVLVASTGGDWIDVRFGNPEYAGLVDELNGVNPDIRAHRKGALDPKAA